MQTAAGGEWCSVIIQEGGVASGQLNAQRAWCRQQIGEEFLQWMHVWKSGTHRRTGAYEWRFSTPEAAFLFRLTWERRE